MQLFQILKVILIWVIREEYTSFLSQQCVFAFGEDFPKEIGFHKQHQNNSLELFHAMTYFIDQVSDMCLLVVLVIS